MTAGHCIEIDCNVDSWKRAATIVYSETYNASLTQKHIIVELQC